MKTLAHRALLVVGFLTAVAAFGRSDLDFALNPAQFNTHKLIEEIATNPKIHSPELVKFKIESRDVNAEQVWEHYLRHFSPLEQGMNVLYLNEQNSYVFSTVQGVVPSLGRVYIDGVTIKRERVAKEVTAFRHVLRVGARVKQEGETAEATILAVFENGKVLVRFDGSDDSYTVDEANLRVTQEATIP